MKTRFQLEMDAVQAYVDLIATAKATRAAWVAAGLEMPERLARFFEDVTSATHTDRVTNEVLPDALQRTEEHDDLSTGERGRMSSDE